MVAINGIKCPKCGMGMMKRWTDGDEINLYSGETWTAFKCSLCNYILKVKHVD